MTRPLSLDIRVRVAAALSEGATTREAAKRFGISVATAVRIGQLSRRGRGLSPRWIGGTRKPVLRERCFGPPRFTRLARLQQLRRNNVRTILASN